MGLFTIAHFGGGWELLLRNPLRRGWLIRTLPMSSRFLHKLLFIPHRFGLCGSISASALLIAICIASLRTVASCSLHAPEQCFPPRRQSPGSEPHLPQIALSEQSQQIAHQQDHKYCAKPYACASACTPPAVAVVSSAPAKNQHQNNNEKNQHLASPFTPGIPGTATLVGLRRVSSARRFTDKRAA